MEKITITFLGTANAIPTTKRNHTAMLLSYKNENILIDCGEGTQRQFKIAHLSPNKLSKILITHWHGDHILGLPGLFQTLAMAEFSKTLDIYGPKRTPLWVEELKKVYNLKISLKAHEAKNKFFETKDFYLESSSMSHGIPSLAYSFVIKEKLRLDKAKLKKLKIPHGPHLGKLQQGKDITINKKKIKSSQVTYKEKGRKITIILDTAPNANTISIAKDSDLLICESSFTLSESKLAKEKHHLTAHDAATIAKKANVKSLVLTHISQRYEHNTSPILNEAKKIFSKVSLAKDFDKIEL